MYFQTFSILSEKGIKQLIPRLASIYVLRKKGWLKGRRDSKNKCLAHSARHDPTLNAAVTNKKSEDLKAIF